MGSSTYVGGSHLEFEKLCLTRGAKMHIYRVHNIKFNEAIGVIHWRGGWRQYVFRANHEVDMSRSCHKEIDRFIDKLMEEWKESLKKK